MWLPYSPGQPGNATGKTMWEGWLSSGQLYFSGVKIGRYDQRWTQQSHL